MKYSGYSAIPPPASNFLPVQENFLSFFPSLPVQTGPMRYAADKLLSKCEPNKCRKYAGCHPVLSPGIFTVFCPHGICYGFEVMATHESPCHFFQIFRSRFTVVPRLIIYDNARKLHQYCLKRKPAFFCHTQFAWDCFHWHGHIGCSADYSLDKYSSIAEVRAINSQVNKQANTGLQHIKHTCLRTILFLFFSSVTFFGSEKHRCILYTFELNFHSCLYIRIVVTLMTTIVEVQIWQNLDTILKLARIGICVSA